MIRTENFMDLETNMPDNEWTKCHSQSVLSLFILRQTVGPYFLGRAGISPCVLCVTIWPYFVYTTAVLLTTHTHSPIALPFANTACIINFLSQNDKNAHHTHSTMARPSTQRHYSIYIYIIHQTGAIKIIA